MSIQIRTAARKKAKLRIGISGPSGSGKTYSSLLLARGLVDSWDEVVLIDTESGSGELYSQLGPYKIITLDAPYTPERYIEAIDAADKSGAKAIVIDSVSHEWDGKGGLLEANELLARAKFKGNTWAAWSDTTPRHQRLIQSILSAGAHVVTTARSKTDTAVQADGKVKKVGTKEIQREGFEYELTVNFNLDRDGNHAMASKDRTELFTKRDPFVISQKIGEELRAWNEQGIDAPDPKILRAKQDIVQRLKMLGEPLAAAQEAVQRLTGLALAPEHYDEIIARLGTIVRERHEAAKNVPPPQAPELPQEPPQPPPAPAVVPEPEVVPDEQMAGNALPQIEYPEEDINPEDIPF